MGCFAHGSCIVASTVGDRTSDGADVAGELKLEGRMLLAKVSVDGNGDVEGSSGRNCRMMATLARGMASVDAFAVVEGNGVYGEWCKWSISVCNSCVWLLV